jgi:hypothetical protein
MFGQAVAAFLRRSLHGGAVRVACGVPWRLSGSRSTATWSVGILGAMYTVVNISWTTLSSGLVRSCSSLADSLGGLYVDACYPGVSVCFELLLQL